MALVVTNAGELLLQTWAIKSTSTPENLTLKLYSNNYTPVATSSSGDFTESSFSGYSAKTLTRSSWNDPTTVSTKAEITYADQTFTASGAGTVYGFYIVGATSGTVIWAEKFASARTLASGDTLTVSPKITAASEN